MSKKLTAQDQLTVEKIASALVNDGYFDDGNPVTVEDLLTTTELTRFIPDAVSLVVKEAIEPELVITNRLFFPINISSGRSIELGSVGAMEAAEIAEGTEYPERQIQMDGGDMVAAVVSKKGLQIPITEEAIADSIFDIIALNLRQAGYALARLKEKKSYQIINEMGQTAFDNAAPGSSEYGVCTGRNIAGAQNGSMTLNDIMDMYAYLWLRGFLPDTIIMHPLAWKIFAHDPATREILLAGNTVASRPLPAGNPSAGWTTTNQGLGIRTKATGNEISGASPWTTALNPLTATYNIAPSYMPVPLTVIVSPHTNYAPAAAKDVDGNDVHLPTTDLAMVQSSLCGFILNREDVGIEEWAQPSRDIRTIKLRERYGHGIFEQGKAIAMARDIVVEPN